MTYASDAYGTAAYGSTSSGTIITSTVTGSATVSTTGTVVKTASSTASGSATVTAVGTRRVTATSTVQGNAAVGTQSTVVVTAVSTVSGSASVGTTATVIETDWLIGDIDTRIEDLTVTARTITIAATVSRANINQWRSFDRAGDYQIEMDYGGSWRVTDRNATDPIQIVPDNTEAPPLTGDTYHIESYSESQVAPDRFRVTLTGQRDTPRGDAYSPVTESGGDWALDFADGGSLALDGRQVGQITQRGTRAGGDYSVPLTLTPAQAAALMDTVSYPDAVVDRAVSDGDNFVVDTHPSDAQTVTISGPSTATLSDGTYAIRDWQVTRAGFDDTRAWRVGLTLTDV